MAVLITVLGYWGKMPIGSENQFLLKIKSQVKKSKIYTSIERTF